MFLSIYIKIINLKFNVFSAYILKIIKFKFNVFDIYNKKQPSFVVMAVGSYTTQA